MKILIQKSEIPIIWVDTFFAIECGKMLNNRCKDIRIKKLYEVIDNKVLENGLICPRACQEDEFEDDIDSIMKTFFRLTAGSRFTDVSQIGRIQKMQMMKVYHDKHEEYKIDVADVLKIDKQNKGYRVNVMLVSEDGKSATSQIGDKHESLKLLQDLKNSIKLTESFSDRLEIEFNGLYEATILMAFKFMVIDDMINNRIPFDMKLHNQFSEIITSPLSDWEKITEKADDILGYLDFLKSDLFREIPNYFIQCNMMSDIMISKKGWEIGDLKDILNISAFLPYCDFVLTDKAQSNRLKRLGIDKRYSTKVFCLSNVENLIEEINLL